MLSENMLVTQTRVRILVTLEAARIGRRAGTRRGLRLDSPAAILHRDPMKVQWKKQSGPLLVSSYNLVSAKTRKRGADDDQSDPHRRVYRSDHAVPVPRLRVGEQ